MVACMNRQTLWETKEDRHGMRLFQVDGFRHFEDTQRLEIDACHCCDCKNLLRSDHCSSTLAREGVDDMNRLADRKHQLLVAAVSQ